MERIDISHYKDVGVNITGFRVVDPDTPKTKEYLKDWKYGIEGKGNFARGRAHPLFVSTDSIRIYVKLYIRFSVMYY